MELTRTKREAKARISLPESADEVAACGKVVQVNPRTDGGYDVAIRIMEMSADHRYRLARFLES